MPLLIAANQIAIPISQGSPDTEVRLFIYWLMLTQSLSPLVLTSCTSPYHSLDCFETSSIFDTSQKRQKKQKLPVGQHLAGVNSKLAGRRLFAKPNCKPRGRQ